jgi:hypothetical protein
MAPRKTVHENTTVDVFPTGIRPQTADAAAFGNNHRPAASLPGPTCQIGSRPSYTQSRVLLCQYRLHIAASKSLLLLRSPSPARSGLFQPATLTAPAQGLSSLSPPLRVTLSSASSSHGDRQASEGGEELFGRLPHGRRLVSSVGALGKGMLGCAWHKRCTGDQCWLAVLRCSAADRPPHTAAWLVVRQRQRQHSVHVAGQSLGSCCLVGAYVRTGDSVHHPTAIVISLLLRDARSPPPPAPLSPRRPPPPSSA